MTFITRKIIILVTLLVVLFVLPLLTKQTLIVPSIDFSQFYYTVLGILHGNAIYDEFAHARVAASFPDFASIPLVNPPAYPPWYYLCFLPLGFFTLSFAAYLWMVISLVALVCFCIFFTQGMSHLMRVFALILAAFFGPVIGHLVVGQQTMPLLLGLAIVVYAHERSLPRLSALGFLLLSLKPHVGLPIVAIVWLLQYTDKRKMARDSLLGFALGILALTLLTAAVDSTALPQYPAALVRYASLGTNLECNNCSSLPRFLESLVLPQFPSLLGLRWELRFTLAIVLAGALFLPLLKRRLEFRFFLAWGIAWFCLSSPYLRNYDYVILLLPLLTLSHYLQQHFSSLDKTTRRATLTLLFYSYLIAGIGTLIFSRPMQQLTLWTAPLALYLAFCLLGAEKRSVTCCVKP